jgi:transcriptional regulator with XRE-family HTH domain
MPKNRAEPFPALLKRQVKAFKKATGVTNEAIADKVGCSRGTLQTAQRTSRAVGPEFLRTLSELMLKDSPNYTVEDANRLMFAWYVERMTPRYRVGFLDLFEYLETRFEAEEMARVQARILSKWSEEIE